MQIQTQRRMTGESTFVFARCVRVFLILETQAEDTFCNDRTHPTESPLGRATLPATGASTPRAAGVGIDPRSEFRAIDFFFIFLLFTSYPRVTCSLQSLPSTSFRSSQLYVYSTVSDIAARFCDYHEMRRSILPMYLCTMINAAFTTMSYSSLASIMA